MPELDKNSPISVKLDSVLKSAKELAKGTDSAYEWQGKPLKAIVITSSGGGGHLTAAKGKQKHHQKLRLLQAKKELVHTLARVKMARDQAIEQKKLADEGDMDALINAEFLECEVDSLLDQLEIQIKIEEAGRLDITGLGSLEQYDLMLDWAPFGRRGVDSWNHAQKQGDIATQEKLVSMQWVGNKFYGPFVFLRTFYNLVETDADLVIDTQAMGTPAICLAVRLVNFFRRHEIAMGLRPPVRIRKVMTDLPTERATHFFSSLHSLPSFDRELITLETTQPLLLEGQSEAEFWNKHIGEYHFSGDQGSGVTVAYTRFPIRDAFYDEELLTRENAHVNGLFIKLNNVDEQATLQSLVDAGVATRSSNDHINIKIKAEDNVKAIMLGSQGGKAILDYINIEIDKAIQQGGVGNGRTFFYIFCGLHRQGNQGDLYSLVNKVLQERAHEIPSKLYIVPLGGQDDNEIAPIFGRLDEMVQRTGGLATMESLAVFKEHNTRARVLLHSEQDVDLVKQAQTVADKQEILLGGIGVWERGNAEYLIEKIGAHVVNPNEYRKEALASSLASKKSVPAQEANRYVDYHSRKLPQRDMKASQVKHSLFSQPASASVKQAEDISGRFNAPSLA